MATSFTKDNILHQDSEGADVTTTINYSAELDGGIAKIYVVEDGASTLIKEQPWKTNGDGSRGDWADEAEVVTWFKNQEEI